MNAFAFYLPVCDRESQLECVQSSHPERLCNDCNNKRLFTLKVPFQCALTCKGTNLLSKDLWALWLSLNIYIGRQLRDIVNRCLHLLFRYQDGHNVDDGMNTVGNVRGESSNYMIGSKSQQVGNNIQPPEIEHDKRYNPNDEILDP